ncbi:hypothetical protein HNV10_03905 [Winogradskyella litoriviva]|uniref:Uncharacterized protein n=1 Tax=Winogradskyella litoriviva TaxID=1220182 RepID=A0ABX2E315_9FLAO|nr:hypothetical protein [Winogradskyella litoriviva]NRD22371.1 hypothetical protein [Winogradskyella litoriviva]
MEKIDEKNRKNFYSLGKSKRFYVLDFEVIEKDLYILKNPANGGDAYHLEKYELK